MSFLRKVYARYVLAESANENPIVEFHPAGQGSRSGSHEIWVTFPNGTKYVYVVDESYAREKHGKTWKQLEGYLKGRENERISKDGKEWKKEGASWIEKQTESKPKIIKNLKDFKK